MEDNVTEHHSSPSSRSVQATASRRIGRMAYWNLTATTSLIATILYANILYGQATMGPVEPYATVLSYQIGSVLVSLISFVVITSASIKRLHDRGMSGWWYLTVYIPILGLVIVFILLCKSGSPIANRYGLPPAPPALIDKVYFYLTLFLISGLGIAVINYSLI